MYVPCKTDNIYRVQIFHEMHLLCRNIGSKFFKRKTTHKNTQTRGLNRKQNKIQTGKSTLCQFNMTQNFMQIRSYMVASHVELAILWLCQYKLPWIIEQDANEQFQQLCVSPWQQRKHNIFKIYLEDFNRKQKSILLSTNSFFVFHVESWPAWRSRVLGHIKK